MMFSGKRALVTGAGGGIGGAVARLLAERGIASMILLDVDEAALAGVAAGLPAAVEVRCCTAAIEDRPRLQAALQPMLAALGPLDVLVNCAGVAAENQPGDIDAWHRIIDVNLHGTYHVILEALQVMPDGGRIVNVASVLGRHGRVRNTAYCTSKHALLGLTKSLALDLASRGITVNAVLPGGVDTPMLQRELALEAQRAGLPLERVRRSARKKIPLGRFVRSEEVAAVVAFLASQEAAAITAQSYVVDGGGMCGA